MEKQENIIATYQQIIQETEQQLQKARKRIRYISLLRLILFVEAVASAIIFWSDGWLKLIVFTVIPIIAFIWLVQSHNRWFYWKDYLKKKIEINQQELRALQYDFSDFDNGKEYIDPSHLYTFDLDIFGEHSLFQYINRTSTPIGKQRLANWFNAHLEEKEAIEQRQEAIRELSSELEFRQQFRLLGLLYKGKPSDTSEIKEWVNSPSDYRKHAFLRILPTAVGIINLLCIGRNDSGISPCKHQRDSICMLCRIQFYLLKRNNQNTSDVWRKTTNSVYLRRPDSHHREKEMHSPALQQLKAELTSQNQTASQSVHRLAKLMNALDQRGNLLMSTILNGLLFWELRQVMQIEKWKEAHSADLPRWIEAIGAIDAYCSLATFSYNHPDYIYPQITSQSFHLQAEALGHPLMNRNKCVRNGIDMEKRPFFIIITGRQHGRQKYLPAHRRCQLPLGLHWCSCMGCENGNISRSSCHQPPDK
ncbi:hypothetical protein NXW43_02170 [Bacteroides thetaiotaomicron]|nr:hypothetical protein NXW43_02170 [Bacteroides thetaiotaomicron]